MTTSRVKSAAELAAITTIQDYLKGDDFLSAIKTAVEKAIDKHMNTFVGTHHLFSIISVNYSSFNAIQSSK